MMEFVDLMWKPFTACLILTGIHAYLGLHVLERQVIFVDLSLAQIAALGATIAFLFGHDLHGPATWWFSLAATSAGAVIFSSFRSKNQLIHQEALIGIVYAVAAALSILILSRTAEGDEHIRFMLIGNILLVTPEELVRMALYYAAIGVFHWRYRRIFLLISHSPSEAQNQGISLRQWDLLFYLTFGFVVTSSVHIAGVLMVFSFLIIPAVGAALWTERLSGRLIFGWIYGSFMSLAGLAASYWFDFPTGASIVATFGFGLLILAVTRTLMH